MESRETHTIKKILINYIFSVSRTVVRNSIHIKEITVLVRMMNNECYW